MGEDILANLEAAVKAYDADLTFSLATTAIEKKIDPLLVAGSLMKAVTEVGDEFGRGIRFLPELFGATSALQRALPVIQKELLRTGREMQHLGTVVIGTVLGDIHDIGKTLVSTLLTAGGFNVCNLGVNVAPEVFVRSIVEHRPDILALSALMTTTSIEQERVMNELAKRNLRGTVRVMIGGGAVTEEYSRQIGADGYGATAADAVAIAKAFVGR